MIKQGMNILEQNEKNRLDFNPDLKQINFLDRRVYKRGEGVYYPSVTTILQYMPKNKFFETWMKDVGHNADLIMRKAGKEGTQVHEAAEALVKGEEVTWMDDYGKAKYSQIVWEMILKFYEFWSTHKPELISTEDFVWSDEHKYAGTADLVVKLDGQIWLLDLKTSNSLHKSYNPGEVYDAIDDLETALEINPDHFGSKLMLMAKHLQFGPFGNTLPAGEIDLDYLKTFLLFLSAYKGLYNSLYHLLILRLVFCKIL